MKTFQTIFPQDVKSVPKILNEMENSYIYAGGTDALIRLREGVTQPEVLVNLKKLDELNTIKEDSEGLHIGAGAKLTDILENEQAAHYPGLLEAVGSVATIQLRNMGTIGGNLCQRPRCWYYRSHRFPCLRKGGDTCYAIYGDNKYHCIVGGGPCFIVHPSDIGPMLIALDAQLEILNAKGTRMINVEDLYVLPEDDPYHETILKQDELITKVVIPASAKSMQSHYVKFRERDSFDFAMVSVAVAAKMSGDTISDIRVAYGGVAPKPWRATKAEEALKGKTLSDDVLLNAGQTEFANADPLEQNEYKIVLARNLLKRAMREMTQA